jgi:hypothetical protein
VKTLNPIEIFSASHAIVALAISRFFLYFEQIATITPMTSTSWL